MLLGVKQGIYALVKIFEVQAIEKERKSSLIKTVVELILIPLCSRVI